MGMRGEEGEMGSKVGEELRSTLQIISDSDHSCLHHLR